MNPQYKLSLQARAAERVLILLSNPTNRGLLRTMLSDRYFVFDDPSQLEPRGEEGDFDLCILDGQSLQRYGKGLRSMRERLRPLLLPVLVLADRHDAAALNRTAWEVADDVLIRPVERIELALRVQSLLRQRAMSVELHRLSNRLQHERRIAQRLQEAALPKIIKVPGLKVDATYRPGSEDATVGGDWYDAFRLSDGRLVFSVGDVAGSGLEAAVTMTNIRQALRGVANLHADPAMMLDAADRALHTSDPERMVTMFVAVFDVIDLELRYAGAGHPGPFLRRANGAVEQLATHGTPLGLPWQIEHATESTTVGEGELLVLYTDGLTEWNRDALAGEEQLRALLSSARILHASDTALAVYDAMLAQPVHDDVAILTVHVVDGNKYVNRWKADSHDIGMMKSAEVAMVERLHAHGLRDEMIRIAQTIIAELIGNVVRYAPGDVMLALDCRSSSPVVHVLDRGPGFRYAPRLPADLHAETGRGLYIVAALATDLNIERRRDGGSHARVVLPTEAGIAFSPPATFRSVDSLALDD